MPNTSPVLRISGPSTGSTSWYMLNGNTASLTPKWGNDLRAKSNSESFLPSMICMAIRAMGMLHTLETSGTVRLARGFASRMYTVSL